MKVHYKEIDLETFPRKDHFLRFQSYAYPYVGATVNVDITEWIKWIKANKKPFHASYIYCMTRAANRVSAFRQRVVDGKIIEFDECESGYTVAMPDETYVHCFPGSSEIGYEEFLTNDAKAKKEAMENPTVEDKDGGIYLYFCSTAPWLSFTDLIQPVPIPADTNPRIVNGKYFEENGRIKMPIQVMCNHSLVDGFHLGKFFENLEDEMKKMMEN